MGEKAEAFRAKAQELEVRAQTVIDPVARSTLLDVARRWRSMARHVDQNSVSQLSNGGKKKIET
jgi:hypothetical protein